MADTPALDSDSSPAVRPKRRWLRISLRTLMLFVLVVSLFCGWLRVKINQAHEQQRAITVVEQLGGSVLFDYEFDPKTGQYIPHISTIHTSHPDPFTHLSPSDTITVERAVEPKGPKWLRELLGVDLFSNVDYVAFRAYNKLDLNMDRVTDANVQQLTVFSNLKGLNLSMSKITDKTLARLSCFPKLERLYLGGTEITDAGLAHLTQLKHLKTLDLRGTPISDKGLEELQKITTLEWLDIGTGRDTTDGLQLAPGQDPAEILRDTRFSSEALKKLREALPNATITH